MLFTCKTVILGVINKCHKSIERFPPFALIPDFRNENTRGNVSKMSRNQIGSEQSASQRVMRAIPVCLNNTSVSLNSTSDFSDRLASDNRKSRENSYFSDSLANFNAILIKFKPPNQVAQASRQLLTSANGKQPAVIHLTRLSNRK